jgi:hypothetical protein
LNPPNFWKCIDNRLPVVKAPILVATERAFGIRLDVDKIGFGPMQLFRSKVNLTGFRLERTPHESFPRGLGVIYVMSVAAVVLDPHRIRRN